MVSTIAGTAVGLSVPLSQSPTVRTQDAARLTPLGLDERRGDAVAVAETGVRGALSQVRGARSQIDVAVAGGREAVSILGQLRDFGRAASEAPDSLSTLPQSQVQALTQRFDQVLTATVAAGGRLVTGEALTATVDPSGGTMTVDGFDLRGVAADALSGDPARLWTSAQDALTKTQTALVRWEDAEQRLRSHQEVLTLAQDGSVQGVSLDLGAEGARLLALQVRQALQADPGAALGAGSILGFFRG
jgi:hypothetical protein